ncbi:MAG: hypothetical protein ABEI58_01155, partial [Candidatus Nanohaloarchaea archaeon]
MMEKDEKRMQGAREEFLALTHTSGPRSPGNVIDTSEKLFGRKHSPERWRAWFDLHYIGAMDTRESFGELFLDPTMEAAELDAQLEELPSRNEYWDSLTFVEAEPVELDEDWYRFDIDGETVAKPVLPVEYAAEHFQRHGNETRRRERTENGDWIRELEAVEETGWGDVRTTVTVENDSRRKKDTIEVEGEFGYPGFLDSPFFREHNWQSYLEKTRYQRIEPLIADVENIYEAARTAVVDGIDIADYADEVPESVETERLFLDDITAKKNEARHDDWDDLSIREAVDKSRQRTLHEIEKLPGEPGKGYYGDLSSDRLVLPLMEYLEEGRDGRVAPREYVESGDSSERAKVGRGNLLAELYFDTVEDFGEAMYRE